MSKRMEKKKWDRPERPAKQPSGEEVVLRGPTRVRSMHLEKYKKMPFYFKGEDDTKVTFTLVNICLGGILSWP